MARLLLCLLLALALVSLSEARRRPRRPGRLRLPYYYPRDYVYDRPYPYHYNNWDNIPAEDGHGLEQGGPSGIDQEGQEEEGSSPSEGEHENTPSEDQDTSDSTALEALEGAVVKANEAFTERLYPKLVKEGKNLICSIFSASAALTMLYVGARSNTAKQMEKGLGIRKKAQLLNEYRHLFKALKSGEDFALEIANKVYISKNMELKKKYVSSLVKHFHVKTKELDFGKSEESRKEINTWVEKKTHDKIKDLIPAGAIDGLTRLVVVNAIYFKGTWKKEFDKEETRKADFHISKSEKVKVDMMHLKAQFKHKYCPELDSDVLELPYKGDKLSMFLFLPKKQEGGLEKLEKKGAAFRSSSTEGLEKSTITVRLPKFKVESTIPLNKPLKAIGMVDMFSAGSADLSGIGNEDLYVSLVIQKAFIEVNEEGTEAAAATAGIVSSRSARRDPMFICDRPFLYAIKEKDSGMVLFSGRVVNPTKGK